jgi:hypothetical protein
MQTKHAKAETRRIKEMLTEVIESARSASTRVGIPKAETLLETTAEILAGLRTAYEHYEEEAEPAMTEDRL